MGLDNALHEMRRMDDLAAQDGPAQRIDPRVKVLVTLAYLVALLSQGRYEVARLLPFAAYPLLLAAQGGVPLGLLIRRAALALPFVIFVGLFNPLIDRAVHLHLGQIPVTGGMLSFASIMLRSMLAVTTGLALVAVTGFDQICRALGRLGMPAALLVQLQFLYRYLFVLAEEALRMLQARRQRCARSDRPSLREWRGLLGGLLLRTLDRAERIHQAMLCRGFGGTMPSLAPARPLAWRDLRFCLAWGLFLAAVRILDLPVVFGAAAGRILP